VWRFEPNPKRPGLKLTDFQRWIVTCPARFLTAVAARRSGKTVGVRARALTRCIQTANGLVGYCGPTLNQAKRIFWPALMRDMRSPVAERFVAQVNQAELFVHFRNGCYLRVYGAERPEQIRGDGFDEFITDESDDPNYTNGFFDEIVHPALSDQQGNLVQIGSPKGRGRLYTEFQKGQRDSEFYDPDHASIQVTAIEAGILKPEEIERARRSRPERAFRQEYMADFLAPAGIVFDEWEEQVHVVDKLPSRFDDIIVGVDWGTSSRGSFCVIGIDRVYVPPVGVLAGQELARMWVIREESHAGLGYDDGGWWAIARDIQAQYQPSIWYCDPAGGLEGYIKQLGRALEGGGENYVVAAKNQVRPGIATMRDLMHHGAMQADSGPEDAPRLLVHESCKHLRRELGAYRYKSHPRAEDIFLEDPVKEEDHCIDAVRYACFTHLDAEERGYAARR
jgi:hypothetical protein